MERHVLHSLAIAKIVDFKSGSKIMDVGTGGGFPGIPLAILFPEVEFLLIDSIAKKIKVVNAVAQSLGLKNVTALHQRAENINQKFDFIISRAVTKMPVFVIQFLPALQKRSTCLENRRRKLILYALLKQKTQYLFRSSVGYHCHFHSYQTKKFLPLASKNRRLNKRRPFHFHQSQKTV